MVKAGVAVDIIIETIKKAEAVQFHLFPSHLIFLKQAGVPDEVIRAMGARAAGRTGPTPPAATPVVTPPAVAEVPGGTPPAPSSPPAAPVALSEEGPYISSGMNEVILNGLVRIPHSDVGSTSGNIGFGFGRYLTDWFAIGPLVSAAFVGSEVHDITLAGIAQFAPRISDRFYLVAGAGVGVNNLKVFESDTDLAVAAYFGPRVFLARHVALDIQYALLYRRFEGLGFKDSSASNLRVGFAVVF